MVSGMAIAFALACLACSVGNEITVKFFARKIRSRGDFVTVVGMTWLALLLGIALASEAGGGADACATWRWGLASGFFSVASNILLIEAMGKQSAGLCVTIFRLNLALVVLGAWLLLGESISPRQWAGVFCAVAAMAAFWPAAGNIRIHGDARAAKLGFALAVAASLLRAGMGLGYKYGLDQGADAQGILILSASCWVAGGLLYSRARERRWFSADRKTWRYGMVSGALCLGITYAMAQGLRHGAASVVLSVAQMSFLGTFILSAWLLGESFTARRGLGLAGGIACILLMASG